MLSSICREKAAAGIFLLKPRSETSGNGGYITGVFLRLHIYIYCIYIFEISEISGFYDDL